MNYNSIIGYGLCNEFDSMIIIAEGLNINICIYLVSLCIAYSVSVTLNFQRSLFGS